MVFHQCAYTHGLLARRLCEKFGHIYYTGVVLDCTHLHGILGEPSGCHFLKNMSHITHRYKVFLLDSHACCCAPGIWECSHLHGIFGETAGCHFLQNFSHILHRNKVFLLYVHACATLSFVYYEPLSGKLHI